MSASRAAAAAEAAEARLGLEATATAFAARAAHGGSVPRSAGTYLRESIEATATAVAAATVAARAELGMQPQQSYNLARGPPSWYRAAPPPLTSPF
eukprot:scaffold114179_cov33-Phaeocystis_antarctica.AAC.1